MLFVTSPASQLILEPFCRFTYITAHSPTLPLLHLRHSSFSNVTRMTRPHSPTFSSLHLRKNSISNPSFALPTSQLILQPFLHFTYVTAHSPTLFSLLLHHKNEQNSFSNVTRHSPTFPSLHLRHSSISNPFRRFTYVTVHSPTLPLLHLRHSSFFNPSFASPTSQASHPCLKHNSITNTLPQ